MEIGKSIYNNNFLLKIKCPTKTKNEKLEFQNTKLLKHIINSSTHI